MKIEIIAFGKVKNTEFESSINEFVNQEELLDIIKSKNFYNASYKNLSGGIVSIHTGWKI